MKRGKGLSPQGKGWHMKWKHKETSTELHGKTYKSWKAAGKATLFVWVLTRPETSLWETGKDAGVWGLPPLWSEREAAGTGQAQGKQGLSKERCSSALPLCSSQGLPSFSQVMQLCAAPHQVPMDKTLELCGSILLPTQITRAKSRHWAPFLRTQLSFIFLCLSCCGSLTNIPPEPCKAAGSWEGTESGDTQKVFSDKYSEQLHKHFSTHLY